MATTHYSTMTFIDKTKEASSVTIYNDAVTAGNIAGYLGQLTTLRNATNALVLGANKRNTWVGDADDNNIDLSLIPNTAQRENKLLVIYQDTTTGKQYQLTLPTIDLDLVEFVPGGKDAVKLDSSAELIAWIAAFEAIASPPDVPANNVEVVELRFVGRNS